MFEEKKIDVLINEKQIDDKINEMAKKLSDKYKNSNPIFIIVLKGAFVFASHLLLKMNIPLNIDFMVISSYGDGTESSGIVRIEEDMSLNIENRHVVIIEDIIDTGTTLNYLRKKIIANNPKSLKIVTLLDKPSRRKVDLDADYSCFEIDDDFVVGFGLDYAQFYRNLPYVGIITEE